MNHKTILQTIEIENEIKKSRFIGQLYHVEDENAIENIINLAKKTHYKATHVCSAYVLGATDTLPERQKASDDGEPSGTAGKPMLEVLNNHELKNVLAIVIRYFGGIKLGAGGLIRAYAGTTADAVKQAAVVLKQLSDTVHIEIDYTLYGSLTNQLTTKNILPFNEDFGEKVTLDFYLPIEDTTAFIQWIREITNDRFAYCISDRCLIDVPCR